jgi:hypothetical protein
MSGNVLISYSTDYLVWIGWCGAIAIPDPGNVPSGSHNKGLNSRDSTFKNPTGLNGETIFTGSDTFTVKELEIFELIR